MKINKLLFAAVLSLAFFSCNEDTPDDGSQKEIYTDIVTLVKNDPGDVAFTFRKLDDSPTITLRSANQLDPKFYAIGTRLVMSYLPSSETHYLSDDITIYGLATAIGAGDPVAVVSPNGYAGWSSSFVNMNSIWRSGDYLNIVFTAESAPTPKKCVAVCDQTTIDSEYPEIHFIFEPESGNKVAEYAFYMSYSLADIYKDKNVKGVKVYFKDSAQAGPVIIGRSNNTITPVNPDLEQ